jgi:hypothetical protein
MALRTWSRVLLTALGMAAAAGAGQLGFAYGLGIVRFARGFLAGAEHHWPGQLAWVAWFAMVATVVGAVAAERVAARHELRLALPGRAGVAAVAALGAAIIAPLTMQPARVAQIAPAINPVLTVGLTAVLGAIAGTFAATAVLSARAAAWNVAALTGAVWFLALMSVAPSLGPQDALPTVRLGVLDLPSLAPGTTRALALIGIPGLALVAGAATAGIARWQGGHHPIVMAVCGAAGPGMLGLAYLLGGPGEASEQTAPYWAAIIAIAAGLLGSVLLAVVPAPGAAPAPALDPDRPGALSPVGSGALPLRPSPRASRSSRRAMAATTGDPLGEPRRDDGSPRAEPSFGAASRSSGDAARAPGAAALTEPIPDPLTAPLDQIRGAGAPRSGRSRAEPPAPRTAPPAPRTAPSPPRPEPSPPSTDPYWPAETRASDGVGAGAATRPEPVPPVVPEPALKRVPTAPPPGPEPEAATGRRGWLSMRRGRAAASTAEAAAPEAAAARPVAPAPRPVPSPRSAEPSTPTGTTAAPPVTAPVAAAATPAGEPRRSRFGRLRRGERSSAPRGQAEPQIAARDEEYVDWVSGLGGDRKSRRTDD